MSRDMERRIARLERALDMADEPKATEHVEPVIYSVKAAVIAGGGAVSRTALYQAVRDGRLRMFKHGKRSFIFASEFRRWLEEMPSERHLTDPPIKMTINI